jgi:hypothetical protein
VVVNDWVMKVLKLWGWISKLSIIRFDFTIDLIILKTICILKQNSQCILLLVWLQLMYWFVLIILG